MEARAAPLTLAAALILSLNALPGAAFHEAEPPVVASGTIGAGTWIAVRATTDGAAWSVWLYNDWVKPEVGGGMSFSGNLAPGGAYTSSGSFGPDVWVRAGGSVGPGLSFETDVRTDLGEGWVGRAASVNVHSGPFVGTRVLVLWNAGHFEEGLWEVRAEPGVTIDAIETGPTFFASASDFDGPGGAQAQVALPGAHAVPLGTVTVEAEHTVIGSFWEWSNVNVGSISMSAPTGTESCSCFLFGDGGPGTYVFSATHAGADAFAMGLLLGGGDVRLPGPS